MKNINNIVILQGNIGKDPDMITFNSGDKCANFSIALSESYKDKEGNYQTKTDWISCVAYRHTAEFIEKHIRKGNRIKVVGSLRQREWTTNEGEKRYSTEVEVQGVDRLDWEKKTDTSRPPQAGQNVQVNEEVDDLPF